MHTAAAAAARNAQEIPSIEQYSPPVAPPRLAAKVVGHQEEQHQKEYGQQAQGAPQVG